MRRYAWARYYAASDGEDHYPVTFPAALISFGETEWQSFNGSNTQRGKGTFTIEE